MRCSDSIAYALFTNVNYSGIEWVKKSVFLNAKVEFEKRGNCKYLRYLPSNLANDIITPAINKIIRSQKTTGGWKVKETRMFTHYYLQAFINSGLHSSILPKLRHDPIVFLTNGNDIYSIAAERIFNKVNMSQTDIEKRVKYITDLQNRDGSWDETVISTIHHLEMLHESGLGKTSKYIQKGVLFIKKNLIDDVASTTKHYFGQIVAKNMFSTVNRLKEFESAVKYKPEWDPKRLCYMHIPNIQNAYAIEILNLLGFEDDPSVRKACDNLVELYVKYRGFCETNIRKTIIGK